MEFIDYYKILGVAKNATESQIKKAYYKLARKLHPDVNPNDKDAEKKFKEINEANEVLSNPESRKKYDAYGKDWKNADAYDQAKRNANTRNSNQQTGFDGSDYSDFFESMFGSSAGGRRQVKYRGQDYSYELHLKIDDVYKAHQRTLAINGKNIRITLPAGISNGQVIKINGKGGDGINGGPNGDLYITFVIENNEKFKLDSNNLYTTVNLDLFTAILGGDITVDTMDGKVNLKVKPETKNGTQVRLKGKGFPVYNTKDTFGDLYITYQIEIPTNLSEKEKELLLEFKKLREL